MITQNNDVMHKLNEIQRAKEIAEEENKCLAERVRILEVTVEDIQFEKRSIEEELVNLKEEQSSKHFEILRLNVLLDMEEAKVFDCQLCNSSIYLNVTWFASIFFIRVTQALRMGPQFVQPLDSIILVFWKWDVCLLEFLTA